MAMVKVWGGGEGRGARHRRCEGVGEGGRGQGHALATVVVKVWEGGRGQDGTAHAARLSHTVRWTIQRLTSPLFPLPPPVLAPPLLPHPLLTPLQGGMLRVGDFFVVGTEWGRVRALWSGAGEAMQEVGPGRHAQVSEEEEEGYRAGEGDGVVCGLWGRELERRCRRLDQADMHR